MKSPSTAKAQRDFAMLFLVMLVTAAGNTALQSVLPALGRSLRLPDWLVALTFSFSALVWTISAPVWARRSDREGHRGMVILGIAGFSLTALITGIVLTAAIEGWINPLAAFVGVIAARMFYGWLGSATPPAAQAMIATRTSRSQRTNALTLLASAFGLGTILGPALAPFFVVPPVGLAGPAYASVLVGLAVWLLVHRRLSNGGKGAGRGAPTSEPHIGGEPGGAELIAPVNNQSESRLSLTDPRIWPWAVAGVVAGHVQALTGQVIAFLVMDRLSLSPLAAQPIIGLVLMAGAVSALLAQWAIIPRLKLEPRGLVIWGSVIAGLGCAAVAIARDVHGLAVAFAIASLGFGLLRPGFTAGASLAVGTREQGAVAGRVTAINGVVYVLGPSLGIALYQLAPSLPYLASAAAMAVLTFYAARVLRPSTRAG